MRFQCVKCNNKAINSLNPAFKDFDEKNHKKKTFMGEAAHVLLVGATGAIGYDLSHWIANGDLYGDRHVVLHLFGRNQNKLTAITMELQDCGFPLLDGAIATTDPAIAFKDVDCAFLLSSFPLPGDQVRSYLVDKNSSMYKEIGGWLNMYAKPSCKVLVISNPTNTNAAICRKYAPNINQDNFHSLSMLDHYRVYAAIADKLGVRAQELKDIIVWGNHGETMVPDLTHATFTKDGKVQKIMDVLDYDYVNGEFTKYLCFRGPNITQHRGHSATSSTTICALHHMKAWLFGTKPGEILSLAIPVPEGNPYGIKPGIIYSFPCTVDKDGVVHIVENLPVNDWLRQKLDLSETDLVNELKFAFDCIEKASQ